VFRAHHTIDHFIIDRVGKKISEKVPQFIVNGSKDTGGSNPTPYIYDPVYKQGDDINVRFLGINAPEILGHGYSKATF
jgi:hypothetical protein